jgi:hypothetical protein
MEAARTSETSVQIRLRPRKYIPEDKSELHTRRRENLKSHMRWDYYLQVTSRRPRNFIHIFKTGRVTVLYVSFVMCLGRSLENDSELNGSKHSTNPSFFVTSTCGSPKYYLLIESSWTKESHSFLLASELVYVYDVSKNMHDLYIVVLQDSHNVSWMYSVWVLEPVCTKQFHVFCFKCIELVMRRIY